MNSNKIKQTAIEVYDKSSNTYGADSFEAIHYGDIQKAHYRYFLLHKHILNEQTTTLLDIGCGNGGFFEYLNANGFKGTYKGIDINKKLIHAAKKKFPNFSECFEVVDIFNNKTLSKYDYVAVCGLFNTNYGQDFNWVCSFVEKMYSLANKKVIFNAISTYTNFKEDNMFYIDPLQISDYIIKNLSPEITLEHGELPYNFQIIINKDEPWCSINA